MRIGIIGSGNVGGALGTRWAKNGYKIVFASRHPDSGRMRTLIEGAGPNAKAATVAEAAAAGDVLLLATPWSAAQEAVKDCGNLSGKIVLDATNPFVRLEVLAIGATSSAGEQVALWARGARVVKAFNTVGYNIMADPKFDDGPVAMFYCGDDPAAKAIVKGLIEELDFEALDAGPLTQSRVLEPFSLLWVSLAMKYGYGREIAFKLLRRNP